MITLGILVATIAAFLISATYYSLAAAPHAADASTLATGPSTAAQAVTEVLRSTVIAGLVAGLMISADWAGPADGALLGLALWTVPVVLLIGSVVHEATPWRSAAQHAGDWLLKLVAVGAIIGLFT